MLGSDGRQLFVGWGGIALLGPDGKSVLASDGRQVFMGPDGKSLFGADARPITGASGNQIQLAVSLFPANGAPVVGPDGRSVFIAADGKSVLGPDAKAVPSAQPAFNGPDGKSIFVGPDGKSLFFLGQIGTPLVDANGAIAGARGGRTTAAGGDLGAEEAMLPGFVISHANPILEAAALCLKRAQQITNETIQKSGPLENEKLLIRSAQELSEAAALLLMCAEILIAGKESQATWKVITAARIIKASVSSMVAQVLVKGGDQEGIMSEHVKTVVLHTDKIIARCEHIVSEQAKVAESKMKQAPNKMIKKLNMQGRINDTRKQLQDEEKKLYQFRKRF
jgi:hypothetical protein